MAGGCWCFGKMEVAEIRDGKVDGRGEEIRSNDCMAAWVVLQHYRYLTLVTMKGVRACTLSTVILQ